MSSPSTDCGVHPVNIVGAPCSGNGDCIFFNNLNRSLCSCRDGWEGFSDFQVTNSLLDCQINVTLVRVLWGIFLLIHIVVYVRYFPKLRWLWAKHQAIVERNKAIGKKYTISQNKGLQALIPYVTVGWLAQTVYAITKIVNQGYKIGDSVFITILYLLWRTTYFYCPDTFQPALTESLLKAQRNLDHLILRNKRLSQLHLLISWLLGIPTIIPMIVSQEILNTTVGMTSVAVFFIGASLSMLFLSVQAIYIERRVQSILEKSFEISKEARTQKIMQKMAANQRQVIVNGGIQFVIYGVFGCFPYLWNKHDYLLPFSWVAVAATIKQVVASLVQDEMSTSSTRDSIPEGNPQQAVQNQPQRIRQPPPESTAVGTLDAISIVEVENENAAVLLATGGNWAKAKKDVESAEN